MKLILASKSPRRRELIKLLNIPFECISADTDESVSVSSPELAVCEISRKKAEAAAAKRGVFEDEVVIGSDTVVVLGEKILGKPRDRADAFATLAALSGKTHRVLTGVTLIYLKNGKKEVKSFFERTEVTFKSLSEREINGYLDLGEYADKAGSYAIQGVFSAYIESVNGDFNNVVGFPVSRVYNELKTL